MKNDKSFKSLLKKMESLKETELGKLRGGISVVTGTSFEFGTNSGTCVNNGDCTDEKNTGTCHNYPDKQ
jgi:hypothetical protein